MLNEYLSVVNTLPIVGNDVYLKRCDDNLASQVVISGSGNPWVAHVFLKYARSV